MMNRCLKLEPARRAVASSRPPMPPASPTGRSDGSVQRDALSASRARLAVLLDAAPLSGSGQRSRPETQPSAGSGPEPARSTATATLPARGQALAGRRIGSHGRCTTGRFLPASISCTAATTRPAAIRLTCSSARRPTTIATAAPRAAAERIDSMARPICKRSSRGLTWRPSSHSFGEASARPPLGGNSASASLKSAGSFAGQVGVPLDLWGE